MTVKKMAADAAYYAQIGLMSIVLSQLTMGEGWASVGSGPGPHQQETQSPIKHVIVIIGENRSFDHVFATYKPVHGETVWNLLSEGIVNADGTPGPNFAKAQQKAASVQGR